MNNLDKLRLLGVVKNKVFIGPQTVAFHITNVCNLKCIYCWFHSPFNNNKNERKIELDFEAFKRVMDDCYKLKVNWIQLSAEGEPTLHSRIIDMINYVKEKKLLLRLLTNGTFNKEILKFSSRIDQICINLSASNSDKYTALQSQGNQNIFNKVVGNISSITALKKKSKTPHIRIGFMLNSQNYNELPHMFKLAFKLNVNELNITMASLERHNRCIELKMDKKINEIFKQIMKEKYFLKVKSNILNNYKLYKSFLLPQNIGGAKACYNGWYYTFINWNGDVTPCCSIKERLIAGNIYNSSFKKVWLSDTFSKIRISGKNTLYHRRFATCSHCCFYNLNNKIYDKLRLYKTKDAS